MSRISVVLITHNRRDQLLRTLRHMTSLPENPPVLVADAGKARERLGWSPEVPDLTDIVRTAVDWHRRWRSLGSAS